MLPLLCKLTFKVTVKSWKESLYKVGMKWTDKRGNRMYWGTLDFVELCALHLL